MGPARPPCTHRTAERVKGYRYSYIRSWVCSLWFTIGLWGNIRKPCFSNIWEVGLGCSFFYFYCKYSGLRGNELNLNARWKCLTLSMKVLNPPDRWKREMEGKGSKIELPSSPDGLQWIGFGTVLRQRVGQFSAIESAFVSPQPPQ